MADEIAAVDSAQPAETASDTGPTDSQDVATHDDAATEQPPTDDATSDTDEADDSGDESDADSEPRSEDEKKLSRSERRRLREQERINQAVEAKLAEQRKADEAKAAEAEAARKAEAAQAAWKQRFGELVGTDEQRASIQKEIDSLISEVAAQNFYEVDNDALERIEAARVKLAEKKQQLVTLEHQKRVYDEIERFQFQVDAGAYVRAAESLPAEFGKQMMGANGVPAALRILEDGIVAREAAKHEAAQKAAVEAVRKELTAELEKERAAHASTRNGAPGLSPAPGGNGVSGSGGMPQTLSAFRDLPSEQRQKLRREQSAYVDDLYRRGA